MKKSEPILLGKLSKNGVFLFDRKMARETLGTMHAMMLFCEIVGKGKLKYVESGCFTAEATGAQVKKLKKWARLCKIKGFSITKCK